MMASNSVSAARVEHARIEDMTFRGMVQFAAYVALSIVLLRLVVTRVRHSGALTLG